MINLKRKLKEIEGKCEPVKKDENNIRNEEKPNEELKAEEEKSDI